MVTIFKSLCIIYIDFFKIYIYILPGFCVIGLVYAKVVIVDLFFCPVYPSPRLPVITRKTSFFFKAGFFLSSILFDSVLHKFDQATYPLTRINFNHEV